MAQPTGRNYIFHYADETSNKIGFSNDEAAINHAIKNDAIFVQTEDGREIYKKQ